MGKSTQISKLVRLAAHHAANLEPLVRELFPDIDAREEVQRYLNSSGDPTVFVAERADGNLVGFIEVGLRAYAEGCETMPVAYIEAWYVAEAFRRKGVGRQLFEAAENWAREQGLSEIASDTLIDNEVSIAAHKALGYQEVERIVCFMRRL